MARLRLMNALKSAKLRSDLSLLNNSWLISSCDPWSSSTAEARQIFFTWKSGQRSLISPTITSRIEVIDELIKKDPGFSLCEGMGP